MEEQTANENPFAPTVLDVRNVSVLYGNVQALRGVGLSLCAGELRAVIGENGAGKSSLMNVLAGLVKPAQGEMRLAGLSYSPADPGEARRQGISMIHQELSVAPHLTVAENIMLGIEPVSGFWLKRAAMRESARSALAALGSDIDVDALCSSLSVSQMQILEIARATVGGSKVLILDEPTSSLTKEDTARLFHLLRRLKEEGYAILYISHFLEEVQQIADTYTVLRDGRVVGSGSMAEVELKDLVSMMLGRDLGDLYPSHRHSIGPKVLEVEALSSGKRLSSASFSLHKGEVLGIFGLVGSGRTELLRSIFALDAAKGSVAIKGKPAGSSVSVQALWRGGTGMVSEDRKEEGLSVSMSIAHNLALVETPLLFSPGKLEGQAQVWLKAMSVVASGPEQPVWQLSGGNQQKVAMARLLAHKVDIFLLDEPTRGVDIGSKRQIYDLIHEAAGAGAAVLIVSSYLPELLGLCDRLAVMNRGVLLPFRPVSEVSEFSVMSEATAPVPGLEGQSETMTETNL
ncbi:MAG: sugar ABC transporter ATP-binding protein [Candidatus Melainabacteria bacterium]|nr:sugar ABC transporter ATP-binding protein [Candidatus Melainabacteria bacterium]